MYRTPAALRELRAVAGLPSRRRQGRDAPTGTVAAGAPTFIFSYQCQCLTLLAVLLALLLTVWVAELGGLAWTAGLFTPN